MQLSGNPLAVSAVLCCCALMASAEESIELGAVPWRRDLSAAEIDAQQSGKPIALLFQEVPGCQTCQNFGKDVLSHPLIVDALTDHFIPVLVYNNRKGIDSQLCARFKEPSWNNPVMRFVTADGSDVIPRRDRVWDIAGTALRLVAALEASQAEVPAYLAILANEGVATERAVFAMHCFWEGQAKLGNLEGVVKTRAGWLRGEEVVEVDFDPRQLSYQKLLGEARRMSCATIVFAQNKQQAVTASELGQPDVVTTNDTAADADAVDRFYYLRNSAFRLLPMTSGQANRINAALGHGADPRACLSSSQQRLLEQIVALGDTAKQLDGLRPDRFGNDIVAHMARLSEALPEVTADISE